MSVDLKSVHLEFCCARYSGVMIDSNLPGVVLDRNIHGPEECEQMCLDDPTCLASVWSIYYYYKSCWRTSSVPVLLDRYGHRDDFALYMCRTRAVALNTGSCPRFDGVRLRPRITNDFVDKGIITEVDCAKQCHNNINCKASTVEGGICRNFHYFPPITNEVGHQARICRSGVISCPAERAEVGTKVCNRHEGLRLWSWNGQADGVVGTLDEEVCLSECKDDPLCLASLVAVPYNSCYLFHKSPGQTFEKGYVAFLCTDPTKQRQCTRHSGKGSDGGEAQIISNIASSLDCKELCFHNLNCKHASHDSEANVCRIFHGTPTNHNTETNNFRCTYDC